MTDGGQASASGDVYVASYGGKGLLTVGRTDGTDAGGSKFSAVNLYLNSNNTTNSGGADATGYLNIYKGGTVQLTGGLITTMNTSSATATTANLSGGTLTANYLNLQSSSHLNWTSGTLALAGGNSTTNGTLAVPATGTLRGSGSISGAVTDLGTIAPGDSATVATLALGSGLTVGASGIQGVYSPKMNFTAGQSDLLTVTGSVTLTNAKLSFSLLNITAGTQSPSKTFLLITNDASDAVAGTFASIAPLTGGGLQYTVNYSFSGTALNETGDGNDVAITFTAVPEPSMIVPLLSSLAMLRRRRRN